MKTSLRLLSIFILLSVLFSLSSCGKTETVGESPLTMYVGLGNTNRDYCEALHKLILDNTGIDVKFIYSSTVDTTNAMVNRIENCDLPADICVTAMATDSSLLEGAFLDLAAYTNLTDFFNVTKIRQCSVDGAVYQIPYTSRLIGIEYNKTLLNEMGWTLPHTYDEMVSLKKEVEDAGYTIAVSGAFATGHGFNYLFHTMGSQYLSTPDGSEWFRDFQNGKTSVDEFKNQSEYFKKYAENGLFGEIHNEDWNASTEYKETRALFYYNIINDVYSYDGFRYNADGTLYGAKLDGNGNVIATKDENGNAVLVDGKYVLYDADNEEMTGLERYSIEGAVELHDTYGSMPWITENGSSNSFTVYDNMFVALDKKLADDRNKLEKAKTVLEFMTTHPCADLYSELYIDGFMATTDYEIDETRLYGEYADRVKTGYLAPWYYNYFDNDSIMGVGDLVNKYLMKDSGVTFDIIFTALDEKNTARLTGTKTIAATFESTLDYKDSATIQAIAGGMSLQKSLDSAGIDKEVTVSLMPYINDLTDLPVYTPLGVVQEKFYAGELEQTRVRSHINLYCNTPVAVTLSGAELQTLIEEGFVYTADDGTEYKYGYSVAVKGGGEISESETYTVAVSDGSLSEDTLQKLRDEGKITDGVIGNTEEGLDLFFEANRTVSADTLIWN